VGHRTSGARLRAADGLRAWTGKDISANHHLDAPTWRVKSSRASESQGDTMETAEVEYRGYVIKHPSSPKAESDCQVYVESENPHLLSRLLGQHCLRTSMESNVR
jgi:hypothetical protein